MTDSQLLTPHAVAAQLSIAPEQLRRWTKDFAAQLSASAVGTNYYRYSPEDVKRLQMIRDLFAQGKSAVEVSERLNGAHSNGDTHDERMYTAPMATYEPSPEPTSEVNAGETVSTSEIVAEAPPPQPTNAETAHSSAVVIHADEASRDGTGAMVLREVLQGFAAGQEAILNSQQANRNLMGVVIQDNFSLKEENAKLRERMMKLEQELNDIRSAQTEQRQQLDQRLRQMEKKKDWLRRLFGI
ncbi:MAG: MerR family transcriptional regulator [Chloroflexi bacterium]|nr:MerR family transcriptional regulator [Chloroflexota bacterium]